MSRLTVTKEVARELVKDYGYTCENLWGNFSDNKPDLDNPKIVSFQVYPKASMLIGLSSLVGTPINLEDVLALSLLDVTAWEAYLTKHDD